METMHVKNLIIGFGKGGKTLAARLVKDGQEVALVERDAMMYGGTCINIGCLPSKSLIIDAQTTKREGEDPKSSYARAIAAKRALTQGLRAANYAKLDGVNIIDGEARFVGDKRVVVTDADGNEREITADRVFINTGAHPRIPDIPGIQATPGVYDSTGMLDLDELPARAVIIGGGFIGLEFASMLADFGVQVTVLHRGDRILEHEDADIAATVNDMLDAQGVRVITSADVTRIEQGDTSVAPVLVYARANGSDEQVFEADGVLVAVGRVPNTEGLGLETAGIEVDARGAVVVDDLLRTTAPDVWAIGDCNGGPQHTYISLDDYRIVWSQLDHQVPAYSRAERRNVASCSFLHVPYARIGMNEQEAAAKELDVQVHTMPAAAVPKARVMRETTGLLKAIWDKQTGEILGVMLLCADAHEMINTVKVAMDMHARRTELRDAIYTHPTMTEAFNDLFA